MDGEIVTDPPYNTNIAPTDLCGPMKVHLGEKKFQSDDELKHSFLNWLHGQHKAFYAAGISNLAE
jgi:adenine-specific DNA methylase